MCIINAKGGIDPKKNFVIKDIFSEVESLKDGTAYLFLELDLLFLILT